MEWWCRSRGGSARISMETLLIWVGAGTCNRKVRSKRREIDREWASYGSGQLEFMDWA